MNRVFEHAGDLVNMKVAHNLMRLIAEGFGEDDDNADSQLRLSAVRFCYILYMVQCIDILLFQLIFRISLISSPLSLVFFQLFFLRTWFINGLVTEIK